MEQHGQSPVRHPAGMTKPPKPVASKLTLNRKALTPCQDHEPCNRLLLAQLLHEVARLECVCASCTGECLQLTAAQNIAAWWGSFCTADTLDGLASQSLPLFSS